MHQGNIFNARKNMYVSNSRKTRRIWYSADLQIDGSSTPHRITIPGDELDLWNAKRGMEVYSKDGQNYVGCGGIHSIDNFIFKDPSEATEPKIVKVSTVPGQSLYDYWKNPMTTIEMDDGNMYIDYGKNYGRWALLKGRRPNFRTEPCKRTFHIWIHLK